MGNLITIGINHKTSDIETREKISLRPTEIPPALNQVLRHPEINESVILSTCNRLEIYCHLKNTNRLNDTNSDSQTNITPPPQTNGNFNNSPPKINYSKTDNFQITHTQQPPADKILTNIFTGIWPEVDLNRLPFYSYTGEESLKHLVRVASGMDSMVIGETEIFGQVKNAYKIAQSNGATGKHLNQFFQNAFSIGKQIRTATQIGAGKVSIGSVTADLAEQIFGELDSLRFALIGTGNMAQTTALNLIKRGAKKIHLMGRTKEKLQQLSEKIASEDVSVTTFDNRYACIQNCDIIISATNAPHQIFTKDDISSHVNIDKQKSLFIIDLGVPRDIAPEVNNIFGVYLYNIDSLGEICERTMQERQQCFDECEAILQEKITEIFCKSNKQNQISL